MTAASSDTIEPESALLEPRSVESEALSRLRLVTAVSVVAEIVLPAVEVIFFPSPDWIAIKIQLIWCGFSLILFGVTWLRWFRRVWKPASLLFATVLVLSTGILSTEGASLAPFMFLLVLLPVGGTILPWETCWQAGISVICLLGGLSFSSHFDWRNHWAISGIPAIVSSILGSLLVTSVLTRQRSRINAYLHALARSELKFRKMFQTSGSLIAICTIPDGRIVDVNPAWERTFGYRREEAVGRLLADLGLMRESAAFNQWTSSLKIGDAGVEHSPVVIRARSNLVHCVYSWATLELEDRNCVLLVGIDITERVKAEEELRHNREVLLNQERVKAVGELASGIAHDFNNSLNALRLWVELLCADSDLTSRHNNLLQMIAGIIHDTGATIGRLQDFARRRHDRPVETVDLNAIIVQSVEMAKSTLEEKTLLVGKSIRVAAEVPGLPLVLGDPSELRQLFLNLLLNAQDAMPAGGTIRITAQVEGQTIAVRIEDQGHGIPQEHLARIFDPFFSTKGERGTGLGLSIAYAAMARMGGSISAANRIEGGAIFTLNFPVLHPTPVRRAQVESPQIQPLRVMVTDDDQSNRQALGALLETKGHTVITAASGAEAVEKIKNHLLVDVILCDLGMPLMNGWEVARQVKSLEPRPAFYLVTGWAAEIPADHSDLNLIDGVIAKPVDPKYLDRLLAALKPDRLPPAGAATNKHDLVHGNGLGGIKMALPASRLLVSKH